MINHPQPPAPRGWSFLGPGLYQDGVGNTMAWNATLGTWVQVAAAPQAYPEKPPKVDYEERIRHLENRTAELLIWKQDAIEREREMIEQLALVSGKLVGLMARLEEPEVESAWKASQERIKRISEIGS